MERKGTHMKHTHFPVTTAFYCQDCAEVGTNSRECACCASRSLLSLANVLNRGDDPAVTPERVNRVLARLEQS